MSQQSIIYFPLPSNLTDELLKFYIKDHFDDHCTVTDSFDGDAAGAHTYLMLDFAEIHQNQKDEQINLPEDSCHDDSRVHYIVINMQPGTEDSLSHFLQLHKVRGLFYKDDPLAVFHKGLHSIFQGEVWVPRKVLLNWVNSPERLTPADNTQQVLSLRETTVLKLVADGKSNQDISEALSISTNTVKVHLYNIYKKLKVSNRIQAVRWFADHGGG